MPTETPQRADALEAVLHCTTLPTLPAVALRVLELAGDPEVTLPQLAGVIASDQGLSAKLLQTVNSSFYGVRNKCSTVNQAVALLGIRAVRSLSLGFSLVGTLQDRADGAFEYPAYWRRALVTALAARRIAAAAATGDEDEAFLIGLLQDIGMIAALRALGPQYARLVQKAGAHHHLAEVELTELGTQHAEMGAALARRWGLPEELTIPIRFHEQPSAAPGERRRLTQCVALGNLVHDALGGSAPMAAQRAFARKAGAWLGLSEDQCDEITRSTAEAAREAAALLRIETGTYSDVAAMLAEARRLREQIAGEHEAEPDEGPDGLGSLVKDGRLRDPLTGALTRAEFECRLGAAFEQTLAGGAPVALVLAELDHLEQLRASRGGHIVDLALVETAHNMEHLLAPTGAGEVIVGRWDTGSIAGAIIGPDREGAMRLVTRCTAELEALSAGWCGAPGEPPVSVSLGLAIADSASAAAYRRIELLIQAAHKALQASQEAGGGQLRAFTPRQAA